MRFVARVAGESAGMIRSCDLRESFRFCAIGFVAARADHSGVGQFRRDGRRIVGVLALRAVAGLAGDVCVASELLLIDDFGVASFADCMSGKCWPARGDLADGIAAIVSVLAETLGDNGGAKDNEHNYQNGDDDGETDEMFSVLEHDCFPGAEVRKRSGPKRHCDLGYRG